MELKEKWLIAVTAGRWQRHGICEAKAAGLKVLAIDADIKAEGFHDADQAILMDLSKHDEIIEELHRREINISGAISFCSDAGMPLSALIREKFNLPGPRPDICRKLLDKGIQRKIWKEKGVPGPEWEICENIEEVKSAIARLGFPLIVKPTDSSGSRGVTKLESEQDDIAGAVSRAFEFSNSGRVIVETFMEGTEFTVETFVIEGVVHVLAVTEKKKVEGTRGTVARELASPNRPIEVIECIKNAVVLAFEALGYRDGPGHAEIILMDDLKVGLVEVAGRGGGFMVFNRFVPIVSGVNVARLTALQSVGLPIPEINIDNSSAVLRFFPSRPGTLKGIHGFKEASKIDGVECGAFVNIGDHFDRAIADGDRLGYILSHAKSPVLAQELADKAEKLIHFEII